MNKPATQILAEKLRKLMAERDWNPQILRDKSGISDKSIYLYLSQKAAPSVQKLDMMAQAFGLEAWQLLSETPRTETPTILTALENASPETVAFIEQVLDREAK